MEKAGQDAQGRENQSRPKKYTAVALMAVKIGLQIPRGIAVGIQKCGYAILLVMPQRILNAARVDGITFESDRGPATSALP